MIKGPKATTRFSRYAEFHRKQKHAPLCYVIIEIGFDRNGKKSINIKNDQKLCSTLRHFRRNTERFRVSGSRHGISLSPRGFLRNNENQRKIYCPLAQKAQKQKKAQRDFHTRTKLREAIKNTTTSQLLSVRRVIVETKT